MSYDTEVEKITTDYRVLDVRRSIFSLVHNGLRMRCALREESLLDIQR